LLIAEVSWWVGGLLEHAILLVLARDVRSLSSEVARAVASRGCEDLVRGYFVV
jgi:hypothetical protein